MTLLNDVERLCRPLEQWPQWDQRQWQSALRAGDLLEPGGCRAKRSPFSSRAMVKGYGRWLVWLDSKSLLDEEVVPGDRITRDRVRRYIGHLEAENASGTVIARIIELKITAAIRDPERDWSWIYRFASSMRARHKPARPKRHRLVHIERLLNLGLDLMEKANSEATTLSKFKTYRDGLMLGLLASRPLRLRNLAGLTLDRTLVRRADGWWIQIPAAEKKTKQPIEVPWPDMPVRQLQTYLTEHRPALWRYAAQRRQVTPCGCRATARR